MNPAVLDGIALALTIAAPVGLAVALIMWFGPKA